MTNEDRSDHNADALAYIKKEVAKLGGTVVDEIPHVGPGYESDSEYTNRPSWEFAFLQAVAKAKKLGADLIAESVDRYIRPQGYDPRKKWDERPTEHELKYLYELADGVKLLTLEHPDAPPAKVRNHQSNKRKDKTKPVGRPKRKLYVTEKNHTYMIPPEVRELSKQGVSLRKIGRATGIAFTKIQTWKKKGWI